VNEKSSMATFYRVLDNAENGKSPKEQSTKERWARQEYNSTHSACPKEWIEKHRKNENDFKLLCSWGLHTNSALDSFLEAVANYGLDPDKWPFNVLVRVGELDGTCAFKHPKEAWNYALGHSKDDEKTEINEMVLVQTWVVEFEGEDLNVAIPEEKGGGVLVRVLNPGNMYTAKDFAKRHGYSVTMTTDEDDINLPFD
jgi:hypothetical protein